MRGSTRDFLVAMFTSFLLCGCGGFIRPPPVTPTEISEEVDEFGSEMIDELVAARARIQDIEFRLLRAASPLCGQWNRPYVGVLVTEQESFKEPKIREIAGDMLRTGEAATIVHVARGGPFDRAGLRAGDELISIAGERIESSDDLMERVLALEVGSTVSVRYRRDGILESNAMVRLDPACPVRFGYATSPLIVPWQVERVLIAIPLGLLKYATDDATLAVAMGHQLAHSLFDRPGDDPLDSEMRADSLGLRIAAAAGFDVSVATAYWEGVAAEYPTLIHRESQGTASVYGLETRYELLPHGDIARRLEGIRSETLRQSGGPIAGARGGG